MTGKTTKSTRPSALVALTAMAAAAMLVLAGPVSAHDRGGDGKHKKRGHEKHFDDGGAAGVIASFNPDTGRLVLTLAGGETVGGLVTRFTVIEDGDDCGHDWDRRSLRGSDCDRRSLSGLHCDRRSLSGDRHDDHDWGDDDCGSTDDLVAGASVEDAFLLVKNGRAFWLKIELEDRDDS